MHAAHLRPALRDMLARAAYASGVTKPDKGLRGALTVATFHRVLPASLKATYPLPGLVATPAELAWILAYMSRIYSCMTLSEAVDRWTSRDVPKQPMLAVTFDDGQRDNFVYARPILERVGVRATFFVVAGPTCENTALWHDRLGFAAADLVRRRGGRSRLFSELHMGDPGGDDGAAVRWLVRSAKSLTPTRREQVVSDVEGMAGGKVPPEWAGLMSWPEIRLLAAEGHEIGSHTLTHPLLPQLDEAGIRAEVSGSRDLLRAKIGRHVSSFCYPNGSLDARCVSAVQEAGYRAAVTTRAGVNRLPGSPLTLARCDLSGGRVQDRRGRPSPARLALHLSGHRKLPAGWRRGLLARTGFGEGG